MNRKYSTKSIGMCSESAASTKWRLSKKNINSSAVLRVHHRAQLNIASGQYLHVTGHLHTERFTNEVGKNRTDAVVKSTDIFSVGSAHEGLNSIELKGIVAADIIKVKEFSMIRVLTTFLPQWVLFQSNAKNDVHDRAHYIHIFSATEKVTTKEMDAMVRFLTVCAPHFFVWWSWIDSTLLIL